MVKQDAAKIRAWKRANTDRIFLEARKSLAWPDRLAQAVQKGYASSKQEYIIQAVEDRLRRDGIPAEE